MFTSYYSKPQFYYPYVIFLFTLYGLVQISIWIFKPKDEHEIHGLNDEEKILIKCEVFLEKGKDLKRKYMWAYLLAKASMWAKAPYTFILFSTCHGFSVGQIGILYLIDAIFSLLSGPFTGILADTLGRKKIALLYPLNTIIVLLMRMSGSIQLAYLAQIMSGVVGNVLSTAYESWLNFEMIKIYGNHKTYIQHFRKNIFSKILFWDSVISLFVTIVGAIIYVR
jgi:hypothetical protein